MSKPKPKFEVCVDSVISAIHAENGGASRVELCDNLVEGGTTPSSGMISMVLKRLKIPVMVMIRPRGGDFCYSEEEFEVMCLDIQHVKILGAHGVVFGVLKPDGSVDVERVTKLVEVASPMKVTFHRAFDMTNDPFKALNDIISIGNIQRILTSGCDSTVLEGLEIIVQLVKQAQDQIIIMPGGGIRESNISRILATTYLQEIHVSASTTMPSTMIHKTLNIHMGKAFYNSEYLINAVSGERLMKMIDIASRFTG
ncbi:cutC copper transporter [Gigaspora rosea]|uniref:Copper homeostasis protein cutC homolog n=1 Tax=Gigaspora rosea TaxID=44941 RepID=A0A397TWT1_9GLOM